MRANLNLVLDRFGPGFDAALQSIYKVHSLAPESLHCTMRVMEARNITFQARPAGGQDSFSVTEERTYLRPLRGALGRAVNVVHILKAQEEINKRIGTDPPVRVSTRALVTARRTLASAFKSFEAMAKAWMTAYQEVRAATRSASRLMGSLLPKELTADAPGIFESGPEALDYYEEITYTLLSLASFAELRDIAIPMLSDLMSLEYMPKASRSFSMRIGDDGPVIRAAREGERGWTLSWEHAGWFDDAVRAVLPPRQVEPLLHQFARAINKQTGRAIWSSEYGELYASYSKTVEVDQLDVQTMQTFAREHYPPMIDTMKSALTLLGQEVIAAGADPDAWQKAIMEQGHYFLREDAQ